MNKQVVVQDCKKRLLVIWLLCTGILSIVLIVQCMFGFYIDYKTKIDHSSEAWNWLLPNVVPTLSIMIGIAVKEFGGNTGSTKRIDPFLYRLALWLSVSYFLVLMAIPFSSPALPDNIQLIDVYKTSMLWISPFQGIVSGALGFFFAKAGEPEINLQTN